MRINWTEAGVKKGQLFLNVPVSDRVGGHGDVDLWQIIIE